MHTRPLVLAALAVTLAAGALGCAGAEEPAGAGPAPATASTEDTAEPLLDRRGFAFAAVGAVRRLTDLRAEPAYGLEVRVRDGENWIDLPTDEAFARYLDEPDAREEILADLAATAEERVARGIADLSFGEARPHLMPLVKPSVALRRLDGEPVQTPVVGDLVLVYAVDTGESFHLVERADLRRWDRPVDDADRLARGNLLERTRSENPLACQQELCGWSSGDGYDATRMLLPELRRDIVDEIGGPAVYAVPSEGVFVALPERLAERIRSRVLEQFTTADDPVSPDVFVERGGELVALSP